ncbi:N-acetyl-L,L-diaminopimelate deacetylase-like [Prochlorococcus marinus str. MIT 9321]|uniref:N-acetyl-L,L-diaminopimelate deacetylase-like n=1 Tax=Prochlorococcus marinus str. MIT 9401 TaxID=167551 RepID=A0A0A2B8Y2_PROMR|nr:amidohydrolase [Prochlorococcus marinus]KGG03188.1 N-acetyl-L,L-diaminopimelate deacetylase-like [Prochlorococcus marinus str. MIT 9321]KGG06506.1 N-acetyl-L,L-diaminopimelate deacetylase-like [Prochlorococcus marinus str. MIT 9322]KGG09255.1 N-acetyl-L,L-diaminopimelate deacetylase-like [Prochlorococcus marinus str. MIT 9401]
MNRDQFLNKIDSFNDELINIRRHIHAHPELSGLENQTAILISGYLKKIGWKVRESVGRTGIVADFGPLDKPMIGLRVDMDALPIVEETKLSFSSKVDGVMHACGHDLHITIGLGVANIVKDLKLNYGTRIIFQPAEEIASGARWMIKDGATNGLTHIFGVHVYPDLSVGTIGIKEGSLTAAAGELKIEIKGKSGHGARPHEGVDAIWAAAKVISGIQESITRQLDPLDPVVITFGKINGGNAFNVLAEKVNLIGTVRCTNLKLFKNIGNWLSENISSLASSCGAEAKIIFREITPPVNNDFKINKVLRDSGIKVLGQENVIELHKPSLGAEDFAEFLNETPGAMFRLGVSNSNRCAPLHSSKFDPDERAIAVGIKVITESIVKLNNEIINTGDK